MCHYTKLIYNRKYKANKKNGGIIPAVSDQRVLYVPTPCGNCMECRKKKARDWQIRLLEEIKHNNNGKFITLTFSNESIAKLAKQFPQLKGYDLDNAIAIRAMRLFNERWRKKFKKAIRHWTITELGHNGTENIHLHGILWTDQSYDTIEKIWNYGHIWPTKDTKKKTYVNAQTVNYIIKYVSKVDHDHKFYQPLTLTSPGIGGKYNGAINKFNEQKTNQTYRTPTGHKIALPSYYRNKIYTDEQKEKLWKQLLDKEQRWVNGQCVDISQGEENYYKLLEHYRTLGKELGYEVSKDYKRYEYEQQRRIQMQRQRINTANARGSNVPGASLPDAAGNGAGSRRSIG